MTDLEFYDISSGFNKKKGLKKLDKSNIKIVSELIDDDFRLWWPKTISEADVKNAT